MKTYFVIPEINVEAISKKISKALKSEAVSRQELKNLNDQEISSTSANNYAKFIDVPRINRFLSLCRKLVYTPDALLSPTPTLVECDITKNEDKFPWKKEAIINGEKCHLVFPYWNGFSNEDGTDYCQIDFSKEFDITPFYRYQIPARFTADLLRTKDDKILYQVPLIKDEETRNKINALLEEYGITNEQLQLLFGLKKNQRQTVYNLRKGVQYWSVKYIYKLTWILSMAFEDIIEIKLSDETLESFRDDAYFMYNCVDYDDWLNNSIEE